MRDKSPQEKPQYAQKQVTSPTNSVAGGYRAELESTSQTRRTKSNSRRTYTGRDNAPERRGVTKKNAQKRRVRRKKGGWPTTSGFRFKEVAAVKEGAFRIRTSGRDFTAFVTLRPPSDLEGDQPRKVWCRRKIQNIQRKFARRGLPFISLAVYEKPIGGKLHVHLLIHVPQKHYAMLKAMENLPEVDVRLRTAKHLPYVLKNRLPMQPDFEEKISKTLRRKKAAKFRGKRWSFSRDALAIIKKKEVGE